MGGFIYLNMSINVYLLAIRLHFRHAVRQEAATFPSRRLHEDRNEDGHDDREKTRHFRVEFFVMKK